MSENKNGERGKEGRREERIEKNSEQLRDKRSLDLEG